MSISKKKLILIALATAIAISGVAGMASMRDVSHNVWYYDAAEYCVSAGLMQGVSETEFAPNETLSRAMLVTILWRAAGNEVTDSFGFKDVADDMWYTDAINWAANCGIVNGVGNDLFDPASPVTKEQMFSILYRFGNLLGMDTWGTIIGYEDSACVSAWAADAVGFAAENNMIYSTDGLIYPQSPATRAEAAYAIYRFFN